MLSLYVYFSYIHCVDGVYRLLYEEVDESEVPIVQFIVPDETVSTVEEFRSVLLPIIFPLVLFSSYMNF